MCISCGKTSLLVPKILTFWPRPWLLTYFCKNLNFGISFWTKRDSAFKLGMDIPCGKTFLSVPKLWSITLTSLWPTFEKNWTLNGKRSYEVGISPVRTARIKCIMVYLYVQHYFSYSCPYSKFWLDAGDTCLGQLEFFKMLSLHKHGSGCPKTSYY